MDTIELFCGAGGGVLASHHLLGHTPVAVAEVAAFPLKVLRARMQQGLLPRATIYDDVRKVDGRRYKGVGCVSGGFPCQDLSAAGSGIGLDGARSGLVWEMVRIIGEARPAYVFAENSPRLRAKGLNRVVAALATLGYSRIAWGTAGARNVGAPHIRDRMWLLARRGGKAVTEKLPADMPRDGTYFAGKLAAHRPWLAGAGSGQTMPTLLSSDAAAAGNRPDPPLWSLSDVLGITAKAKRHGLVLPTLAATDWKSPYGLEGLKKQLAKRSKPLRDVLPLLEGGRKISPTWAEWYMGWPADWTDLGGHPDVTTWRRATLAGAWWTDDIEEQVLPRTLPSAEGVPDIGARIKALGNGQVPLCAAAMFTTLKEALG
jgi:site-specific DNA-cytosine methylase